MEKAEAAVEHQINIIILLAEIAICNELLKMDGMWEIWGRGGLAGGGSVVGGSQGKL